MKAVIYARYSSDSQREESIEGQLRECKEYAERNGITVLSTYIDRALSAKTDNRPDFQRMIKDSAKGLFDIVLVWKLDRFARNRYDSAHYKAILKKNGVKVVSAKEAIAEDSTGILLESLLEGYAEFYSVELSEKIHRGQKENALKGLNNGGGIPLGYVLGDEGGGVHLGRNLLNGIFKGHIPLKEEFLAAHGLNYEEIIRRVYREPYANRFLASFAPFIHAHTDCVEVREMVRRSFRDFAARNLSRYPTGLPVSLAGGVAAHFEALLREALEAEGYRVENIVELPAEGLLKYHHGA